MVTEPPRRDPLDPHAALLIEELAASELAPLTSMTPAAARRTRERRYATDPTPVHSVTHRGLGGVPCTVYRPTPEVAPAVVWMHGGGWVMGGHATHDELFRQLALRSGCHVIAPEYRLAPEHPFPAALDDGAAVLTAVAAGEVDGANPGSILLGGDSAGGNLAIVMAMTTDCRLNGLALAYPVTDASCSSADYELDHSTSYLQPEWMRWFSEHYLDGHDAHDWRVSPVFADDSALARLPDTLLVVAAHDPLRLEAHQFAARLSEAGVAVNRDDANDLPHGFLGFLAQVPAAAERLERLAHWINSRAV